VTQVDIIIIYLLLNAKKYENDVCVDLYH